MELPGRDASPTPSASGCAPHVTNLDRPVFALVNLPETVKGALFARYSRYPGTLRRLFLDEFAATRRRAAGRRGHTSAEGERAAQLYERIFLGYGDDSVAQLGGAHVACEWVSNVLTKVLQRPRLGGLPRAVDALHRLRRADARPARRLPLLPRRRARPGVRRGDGRAVRHLRRARCRAVDRVGRGAVPARATTSPRPPTRARSSAKALDLLRGLLPASSLSHMGIFATGQTYEQLDPAPARPPAAGGARLRRHDPARGAGGDAELRRARRAARPRRRLGRLPRASARTPRAAGSARPRPRPR